MCPNPRRHQNSQRTASHATKCRAWTWHRKAHRYNITGHHIRGQYTVTAYFEGGPFLATYEPINPVLKHSTLYSNDPFARTWITAKISLYSMPA